jgi:hypothetical protein
MSGDNSAARIGWGVILIGAAAYDAYLVASNRETLSAAAQQAHRSWPWAWRAGVGVLVAHLSGLLPKPLDPFYLFDRKP